MSGDIRLVDDPDELERFYGDTPAAHIYALADLEEPYWSASRWYRRGDAVVGFVGLAGTDFRTVYAVSTRAPDETLTLLVELADLIEPGTLLTGPTGLAPRLSESSPLAWNRSYQRYVLDRTSPMPPPDDRLEPLGPAELDEILALHATDPDAAFFLPSMLTDGTFVGIRDGSDLVAVAGTHVLSERKGVAALGGVLTHPRHRGRGLGRSVSAGVIAGIFERVDVVGLNSADRNVAARRVYASLGFVPLFGYEEAETAQA